MGFTFVSATLRTNVIAAGGAVLGTAVSDLLHVAEPGQLVMTAAAAAALGAVCTESRPERAMSWLTVRALLGLNLATFGVQSWARCTWLSTLAFVVAGGLLTFVLSDVLPGRLPPAIEAVSFTRGDIMLTPFQRQDLDLFQDAAFQGVAHSVSPEVADHVRRIGAATGEQEMVDNKLGESNEQLVEALERFAAQPWIPTAQAQQATQLAERIRSALSAAERP